MRVFQRRLGQPFRVLSGRDRHHDRLGTRVPKHPQPNRWPGPTASLELSTSGNRELPSYNNDITVEYHCARPYTRCTLCPWFSALCHHLPSTPPNNTPNKNSICPKGAAGPSAQEELLQEAEIMASFSHSNILALKGIVLNGTVPRRSLIELPLRFHDYNFFFHYYYI